MSAQLFWALAGAVLAAASVVVSSGSSRLRGALGLAGTFAGLACLFALLGAPLLGAFWLVAAAGNGLALFLLEASGPPERGPAEAGRQPLLKLAGAALAIGLVAGGIAIVYRPGSFTDALPGSIGPGSLGASLYSQHALAVYTAAALLLAAVVATLALGKRRAD
ncbi:MAG: NADH-quinone oxidoreductase subunit J [Proteobacteria bacterium]|nr:NADH-quinone oxidoreductase subunit J [Pseudomonadota bacterium]